MSSSGKRSRRCSFSQSITPTIDIVIDSGSNSARSRSSSKKRKAIPDPLTFRLDGPSPFEPTSVGAPSISSSTQPQETNAQDPPDLSEYDELLGAAFGDAQEVPDEGNETHSTKKNANDYLREWLTDACDSYVDALYGREAPPESNNCDSCLEAVNILYRCSTCLGQWSHCNSCLLSSHSSLPMHRVEVWDGSIWAESSLAELGLVLNLGHRGRPCDALGSDKCEDIYTGDMNGFATITVRFCSHPGAPSKCQQLLAAGIFPCTTSRHDSAFTLSLLDTLNIFTTLGRTSAHKLYSVLERISKPGFPADLKDRYRQMMTTHRKFLHVSNLKRSGHHFPPHSTDVLPGDQALECVACPRPGWNFDWSEVLDAERVWFRFFMSYDGNFRSVRKVKKVSAGDICFSDGLAYFGPKEPYKKWTESQSQSQRNEKPTCDNHKAGNDTGVKWAGQDVTGIGAFTCTSHSVIIPRGVVDFFKGERFIYADYAFASAVQYLTRLGPLAFGMTYDVWCHWITNFVARARNLPVEIALPILLDLIGAILKWHIVGHDISCYVRWALDNMQYVGRMEGEGVERVWAHLNEHSGSTSEQGPGVRTDSLNNMAGQWNFEKMISLSRLLPPKFIEARRMMLKQRAIHEDLASSLPSKTVEEWKTVSFEPVQGPNKTWSSPMMDPLLTNGFHVEVQAGREEETTSTRISGRKPGVTRWIASGIELEHSMRRVHDESKALGRNPTPRQANALNKKRTTLYDRILDHNKKSQLYMADLDEPDRPDHDPLADESDALDSIGIYLPSSYRPDILAAAGLSSLVEQERKLRRGMCIDTIECIKRLLSAKAIKTAATKRRQRGKAKGEEVAGQIAVTRAKVGMRAHSEQMSKARWRYDNSRSALLRLEPSEGDLKNFLEIKDEDLKPLQSFLEDDSRGIGQGYTSISWIWRNMAIPNVKDWQVNALRTEWFRSRERYKRWEEQLVLLKREMVMAIRSFQKRATVWQWKSSSTGVSPGMKSYAMKCARFYDKLARRMFQACKSHINASDIFVA